MSIAKTLKSLREKEGYSQDYVAKHIAISRPTYIQIEKGEREISISEAQMLASLFGITLDDFLNNDKSNELDKTIVNLGTSHKLPRKAKQEIRINVPQKKVEKFKEVLLYVLEKIGARPNVGESVIYKILYFIDFDYYEKFEEQLMGATYQRNHFGPTPVEFSKIVAQMEENGEIEKVETKFFKYQQKKYLPRREPKLNLLTAQEIGLIDDVINKLGSKTAKEISEYSHKDVPWLTTAEGSFIDYEAVFYRTPEYSVRSYDDHL